MTFTIPTHVTLREYVTRLHAVSLKVDFPDSRIPKPVIRDAVDDFIASTPEWAGLYDSDETRTWAQWDELTGFDVPDPNLTEVASVRLPADTSVTS